MRSKRRFVIAFPAAAPRSALPTPGLHRIVVPSSASHHGGGDGTDSGDGGGGLSNDDVGDDDDTNLRHCLRWLCDEGACSAEGLAVVRKPGRGACVVATRPLEASAPLMAIPFRLALGFSAVEHATTNALLPAGTVQPAAIEALRSLKAKILSEEATTPAHQLLLSSNTLLEQALSIALVVHERFVRRERSFWSAYLRCIPANAAAMGAAYWPEVDLRESFAIGAGASFAGRGGSPAGAGRERREGTGSNAEANCDDNYDDRSGDGHGSCHFLLEEFNAAEEFLDAAFSAVLLPLVEVSEGSNDGTDALVPFPRAPCTRNNLRWAMAAWRSRAMAVPAVVVPLDAAFGPRGAGGGGRDGGGSAGTGALLPGLDFFNHRPNGALSSFEKGVLRRRPVAAGGVADAAAATKAAASGSESDSGDTAPGNNADGGGSGETAARQRGNSAVATEPAIMVALQRAVGDATPAPDVEAEEVCISYGAKEAEEWALFYNMLPYDRRKEDAAATARVPVSYDMNWRVLSSTMLLRHAPPPPPLLAHAQRLAWANHDGSDNNATGATADDDGGGCKGDKIALGERENSSSSSSSPPSSSSLSWSSRSSAPRVAALRCLLAVIEQAAGAAAMQEQRVSDLARTCDGNMERYNLAVNFFGSATRVLEWHAKVTAEMVRTTVAAANATGDASGENATARSVPPTQNEEVAAWVDEAAFFAIAERIS